MTFRFAFLLCLALGAMCQSLSGGFMCFDEADESHKLSSFEYPQPAPSDTDDPAVDEATLRTAEKHPEVEIQAVIDYVGLIAAGTRDSYGEAEVRDLAARVLEMARSVDVTMDKAITLGEVVRRKEASGKVLLAVKLSESDVTVVWDFRPAKRPHASWIKICGQDGSYWQVYNSSGSAGRHVGSANYGHQPEYDDRGWRGPTFDWHANGNLSNFRVMLGGWYLFRIYSGTVMEFDKRGVRTLHEYWDTPYTTAKRK